MRQITDVIELREIQMKVLDCIHDFCEKNNIQYSISSGTLLGAIRHGGFIPWDDDIDIYMPRASYEIFIKAFQNYHKRYELLSHETNPQYPYNYVKVVDNNTIVKEKGFDMETGVWVDIFPIDNVSDYKFARALQNLIRRFLMGIIFTRLGRRKNNYIYKLFPMSQKTAIFVLNKVITSVRKSNNIINLSIGGPTDIEKCFPSKCFLKTIPIKFENRIYKAMQNSDEYLQATYGDYMKIPPVEYQVHHDFVAYIK